MSEIYKTDIEKFKTLVKLAESSRWTKHAYARDKNRKPCMIDSEKACSFCLSGLALRHGGNEFARAVDRVITFYAGKSTEWFNDSFKRKNSMLKNLKKIEKQLLDAVENGGSITLEPERA